MTHTDVLGRLVKWNVELGEYDIEYQPRTTTKAKTLSDFIRKMMEPGSQEVWRVFVDGAVSR